MERADRRGGVFDRPRNRGSQTRPGRFLVGVECDGATYRSSPTARDRDRLRQEVLEGLGWQILRVWSTDWFKNRERALERLLTGIDEAKAGIRPAHRVARVMRRPVRRVSRAEEAVPTYDPRGIEAGARPKTSSPM